MYRIRGWAERYENAESRKYVHLSWLPTPNKHHGLGFRRMVAQRDRSDLFCAWVLVAQVASRVPRSIRDGRITDSDGRPLGAADLALMTGFPEQIFVRSLEFFSDPAQSWLEVLRGDPATSAAPVSNPEGAPDRPAKPPTISGDAPDELRKPPVEQNRTEQNRSTPPLPPKGDGGDDALHLSAEPGDGSGPPRSHVPYIEIVSAWNSTCLSLPKVEVRTSQRERAMASFWRHIGSNMAAVQEIYAAVEASDFLSGRNGAWGKCNFDWVMKPANVAKIIEGNYRNDRDRGRGRRTA